MKLYLSSYRVPTPGDLEALVHKPLHESTVGIIINAKDPKPVEEKQFKLDELAKDLGGLGLQTTFVDLNSYTEQSDLAKDLKSFDIVYGAGGNTFALRLAMKRSGFDGVIKDVMKSGVVYAGESAGAIVVGPSLKGFERADSVAEVNDVVWEGLNLIRQTPIPHADSPDYADRISKIIDQYKSDPDKVILNDNQALVIDGNGSRVVTGK